MFNANEFIAGDSLASVSDTSQAGADAQLFSTLCEIDKVNYIYLFERCKAHNINARQLRYLEKDHIRRIIPADQVGILAEFEYMHNEWKNQKQLKTQQLSVIDTAAATSSTTEIIPITPVPISRISSPRIMIASCKTISNENTAIEKSTIPKASIKRKFDGKIRAKNPSLELHPCDIPPEYPLDEIIKNDMRNIREEYKINGILTERERRRLAGALVDYFRENDIYMSRDIMDGLADQISSIFPTESKRAWHDTEARQRRGRLCLKLYNVQRTKRSVYKRRQCNEDEANNTKSIDLYETTQDNAAQEDENEDEAARLQLWLHDNKCEDNDEVVQMWYETTNYRIKQLKKYNLSLNGEHLGEILENWPSYQRSIGNVLISIDFNVLYPNSENTFYERWPLFLQKIHKLYKLEIRSDLYDQFLKNVHILTAETKEYILINLLHTLVKPKRPIHPKQMARRFSIQESSIAFSKIIKNPCEMDDYTQSQPFIFVQGSLFNVEKVYVAFKDIRYEMKFMDALLTCMQIHQTFKIDYPFACYNFWILIQAYFFNITPEAEINMSVIDHIIKFLLS